MSSTANCCNCSGVGKRIGCQSVTTASAEVIEPAISYPVVAMLLRLIDCTTPLSRYQKVHCSGPRAALSAADGAVTWKYQPCAEIVGAMIAPASALTSAAVAAPMVPGPKAPKASACVMVGWIACSMSV